MRSTLDFRERSQVRRALYSIPMMGVILILLVIAVQGAWGMYEKHLDARGKESQVREELAALNAREAELRTDIEQLSSERGIEAEIRERFMVAKEGEQVIVLTDEQAAATEVPSVTVPDSIEEKKGILDWLR